MDASRGSISPKIADKRLDFPQPTSPMTHVKDPGVMRHDMSFRINGCDDISDSTSARDSPLVMLVVLLSRPLMEARRNILLLLTLLRLVVDDVLLSFFASTSSKSGFPDSMDLSVQTNVHPVMLMLPGPPSPSSSSLAGSSPFTTYSFSSGRPRYFLILVMPI